MLGPPPQGHAPEVHFNSQLLSPCWPSLQVPYQELNHQLVMASALESETQQQMAVLEVRGRRRPLAGRPVVASCQQEVGRARHPSNICSATCMSHMCPRCTPQGRPLSPNHFPNDPGLWDETLDLTPYINTSAFSVSAMLFLALCLAQQGALP